MSSSFSYYFCCGNHLKLVLTFCTVQNYIQHLKEKFSILNFRAINICNFASHLNASHNCSGTHLKELKEMIAIRVSLISAVYTQIHCIRYTHPGTMTVHWNWLYIYKSWCKMQLSTFVLIAFASGCTGKCHHALEESIVQQISVTEFQCATMCNFSANRE